MYILNEEKYSLFLAHHLVQSDAFPKKENKGEEKKRIKKMKKGREEGGRKEGISHCFCSQCFGHTCACTHTQTHTNKLIMAMLFGDIF